MSAERCAMNKEVFEAKREARIMERCETLAREIIAELATSSGEQGEDIYQLEGMIEVWQELRVAHEDTALLAAYQQSSQKNKSIRG
jgi:hypothetical protein